jgi:thiol-disulfide isomerase/thioredoxin/YHS domain-containing protein
MHNTRRFLPALAALLLLPSIGAAQQSLRWEASLEAAQRLAGQTNRLVLIQFWAPWCGVCKRMEAEVLSQPSVANEIATNYVCVKINADAFPSVAQRYGVTGLPTTAITSPQGQLLDTMRGRFEAGAYVARLNRVAADAKQRVAAAYAQVPGPTTPTLGAASAHAPTMAAPVLPSVNAAQPPANANPPVAGGPALIANPQASFASNQPAIGNPALPESRYTEVLRPNQQANQPPAQGPIAQPASVLPNQANPQYPVNNPAPVQTAMVPGNASIAGAPIAGATQPPIASSVGPAYGAQSPAGQPPVQQPMGQQPQAPQAPPMSPPLALDGFCPVSLVEKQQWAPGDRRWGATHRGRTYLFAGPAEQQRFFADPDRFAPAASGNDVIVALEQGQDVPGLREHGVFFGNRIYLFATEASLDKFARNPHQYVNQMSMGASRTGAMGGQVLR